VRLAEVHSGSHYGWTSSEMVARLGLGTAQVAPKVKVEEPRGVYSALGASTRGSLSAVATMAVTTDSGVGVRTRGGMGCDLL
jgi:hypothetical protein